MADNDGTQMAQQIKDEN
jgi:hypothetical protein